MNIYVIRHGETDWNAGRRIQGRSDIPLNERGRRLAEVTAEALKDIDFGAAYSSPLKRAMETAGIILRDRDIPIMKDDRIMEMSFGIFEGEVMDGENPRLKGTGFMHFFSDPGHYIPPEGGESFGQVCRRTTEFLKELAANPELQDQNVLVSSHGAAIKGLLSSLYPSTPDDFWHGGVHKNCAVSLITVRDGKMELKEDGKVYY